METLFLYIFIASVTIQCYYILFIFSRLASFNHSTTQPLNHSTTQPVSVIVCAHNELSNLKELLPELLKQDHQNYEMIIVDDRSDDGTFDYVKNLAIEAGVQNFEPLKIIRINKTPPKMNPKKYALTQGIKSAKHDLLLFTDADCMPLSERWISEMQKQFSNGTEIVLGYSQYYQAHSVPSYPGAPPVETSKLGVSTGGAMRYALCAMLNSLIRYETLYTAIQYFSFALINKPYMGVGRNLAYKKELFIKHNGFASHMQITGGDDDLFINQTCRKVPCANISIAINKESQTTSKPKETIHQWFIQKKRHLAAGKYYNTTDKIRLTLLLISQLFFYISVIGLLISQKFLLILVVCFILRTSLILFTFAQIIKKLGDTTKWYLIPLLEPVYVVYYLFTGAIALFSKNTRWN
ncbi:MAG: glycosyltransferase [Cytophagales bacterium]|nr:glycosyltransferase [Cytophagales bacterium]